jgi:hypothetical protein
VDTGIRVTSNGQLETVSITAISNFDADFTMSGCAGPVELDLPALVTAAGSFSVIGNGTVSVSAPLLAEVTGSVRVTGGALLTLDLRALGSVGQDLLIENISAMMSQPLSFPSLTAVTGNFHFDKTSGFSVLAVPLLATVGGSPGGITRGSLLVDQNATLTSLTVSGMRHVVVDLTITDNPLLTGVEAAMLDVIVGGKKTICGNADDAACMTN